MAKGVCRYNSRHALGERFGCRDRRYVLGADEDFNLKSVSVASYTTAVGTTYSERSAINAGSVQLDRLCGSIGIVEQHSCDPPAATVWSVVQHNMLDWSNRCTKVLLNTYPY